MFSPECIADQRHRRSTRSIFIGRKRATQHRFNAQRVQIIRHHRRAADALRLALTDQIERTLCRHTAAGKNAASISISCVFQKRRAERIKTLAQCKSRNQPINIFNRQRTEQKRVDGAKDRGVRTDANCQRRDGNQREARLLKQHPHAIAKILPKRLHFIRSR